MTGRVLDFEELSTEMDIQAAEKFVAAQVGRQIGTLEECGEEVAAALDAEGLHEAADMVRAACTDPLDITLKELTIIAMMCGRVPVVSLPMCEHPATNPEMAAAMREYDANAGRE